jgi:hypothetical protein
MSVVECDVPTGSMLGRELIERAYLRLIPSPAESQGAWHS